MRHRHYTMLTGLCDNERDNPTDRNDSCPDSPTLDSVSLSVDRLFGEDLEKHGPAGYQAVKYTYNDLVAEVSKGTRKEGSLLSKLTTVGSTIAAAGFPYFAIRLPYAGAVVRTVPAYEYTIAPQVLNSAISTAIEM
jgi:hypothetical protein